MRYVSQFSDLAVQVGRFQALAVASLANHGRTALIHQLHRQGSYTEKAIVPQRQWRRRHTQLDFYGGNGHREGQGLTSIEGSLQPPAPALSKNTVAKNSNRKTSNKHPFGSATHSPYAWESYRAHMDFASVFLFVVCGEAAGWANKIVLQSIP